MANNKIINTRIKNRIDSLSAWQAAGVELLKGEIALVQVPTGDTYTNPVTNKTEPVVELLMKVGAVDSSNNPIAFNNLPWVSAKAADVFEWAKTEDPSNVKVKYEKAGAEGQANTVVEATLAQVLEELKNDTASIGVLNGEVAALKTDKLADITVSSDNKAGIVKSVTKVDNAAGSISVTHGTIDTTEITDAAVTTAKIADAAVTDDKINSVSASKVIVQAAGEHTEAVTLTGSLNSISGEISQIKTAIAGGTHFIGEVSATPTTGTVKIGTNDVTAALGDIVICGDKEYIYVATDTWKELGDLSRVGAVETAIAEMTVTKPTAAQDEKIDIKVVKGVTQTNGKIEVEYAQLGAASVGYDNTKSVKTKIDDLDAAIAGKADSGHEHPEYANANAFGNIKVGNDTITADAAADTVNFTGTNVTISVDAANDTVDFAVAAASTEAAGIVKLSSAVDSTSEALAATPAAVKTAYDVASTANSEVSGIKANYVHTDDDNHLVIGASTDYIIFDCGGAATN